MLAIVVVVVVLVASTRVCEDGALAASDDSVHRRQWTLTRCDDS